MFPRKRETNWYDDRLANYHLKYATHIKNDDGGINKISRHSVAGRIAYTEVAEDTILLKEPLHRFNEKSGERGTRRNRVNKLSASNLSSRTREMTPSTKSSNGFVRPRSFKLNSLEDESLMVPL